MSEAAKAIVSFGFNCLDAVRIEAKHAIWNKASERVIKKLGMTFVQNVPQGFMKNGEWVAENLLAITKAEWEQLA